MEANRVVLEKVVLTEAEAARRRAQVVELLARAALEVLLRRASARQLPELREDEGEGRGEPGQGGEDAR